MFDDWRLQRMNLVILFYVYIYVHFVVCSSAFLILVLPSKGQIFVSRQTYICA